MSGYTMYNAQSNGPLPNGENYFSNNTVAIGGNYKALDNNYELRLWAIIMITTVHCCMLIVS